jgi:predicted ABC-type ATPase
MSEPPVVIVLAGPNGSGKTTASRTVLAERLGVLTFVNADVIAQGLSGFSPEAVALEASRIMLDRIHRLADQRASFAFETTLAARGLARWLRGLKSSGYRVELAYFWLTSVELNVARVAYRVSQGGHSVPEKTIRQRYKRSAQNFFGLYHPLASLWQVYDNSRQGPPRLVASGDDAGLETVLDADVWQALLREGEE